MEQTTPLQIADALDGATAKTIVALDALRKPAKQDLPRTAKNRERLQGMACLGRYYSSKIRGACA